MHILITTAGSRGDLQPYVALGKGFQRAGHTVTVATHEAFKPFVHAHGLNFRPLTGDPQALLRSELGKAWLETSGNPIAFIRIVRQIAAPLMEELLQALQEATRDADAVLFSPLTFPVVMFAEHRRIPAIFASPMPLTPTREFPFIVFSKLPRMGGWFNHASTKFMLKAASLGSTPLLNRWRRDLGLEEQRWGPWVQGIPSLYGFSQHIVQRPHDWPSNAIVTGNWVLEPPGDYAPTPALSRFLEDGPPPVYVGFGSMTSRNPEHLTTTVIEALQRAGLRGILLNGWAGLGRGLIHNQIMVVDDVPHEWLFPRVAAVVHHGGAGTTAAGLRAGKPSVIVPHFGDQPFWAARVAHLGAGPRPIPAAKLTPQRLAAALTEAVTSAAMQGKAAALGEQMQAENGIGEAITAFERLILSQTKDA